MVHDIIKSHQHNFISLSKIKIITMKNNTQHDLIHILSNQIILGNGRTFTCIVISMSRFKAYFFLLHVIMV